VDEQTPAGTKLAWDQAERRLEAQFRQADSLDTKAGTLVGLHALAAGILAANASRLHGLNRWVGFGVIVGLILGGYFAVRAYLVQAYDRRPSPQALWMFAEWEEARILRQFLSTRFESLEQNSTKLEAKARSVTWSLRTLALVALGVAIAMAVEFLT
jgi:hypothetical protein